jgi:hypothetical protein
MNRPCLRSNHHAALVLGLCAGLVAACAGTPAGAPGDGGPKMGAGAAGNAAAGSGGGGAPASGVAGAGGSATAGTAGGAGGAQTGAGCGPAGTAGGTVTGSAGASGGATPDGGAADLRDAPAGVDAPATADAAPLQACAMPSIDHLQSWTATQGEGDMMPSGGSLLVKEGDHYVGKVTLIGTGWHVLPVYLTNAPGGGMVDLSQSSGFTLTYSSTADLWIQMRPVAHWNGGVQWVTKIPSTAGVQQSHFFSLDGASWTFLQSLGGMPSWPYEEARAQVRGFVFVGNMPNTVVFVGLRFDGYVPTCRP